MCALALIPINVSTFYERAAPDAPERLNDQRRCTPGYHEYPAADHAGAHPYRRYAAIFCRRATPDAPEWDPERSDQHLQLGRGAIFTEVVWLVSGSEPGRVWKFAKRATPVTQERDPTVGHRRKMTSHCGAELARLD